MLFKKINNLNFMNDKSFCLYLKLLVHFFAYFQVVYTREAETSPILVSIC